jgi:hypothetical protein
MSAGRVALGLEVEGAAVTRSLPTGAARPDIRSTVPWQTRLLI